LRYLVDRLWPRGIKKDECRLDGWLKELAPTDELRRWFGHDPSLWEEFQRRYTQELSTNSEACRDLARQARKNTVTLLYGARDREHNQALVLKSYVGKFL
jgi:uncharacterized protein YeaO (DUF488 family)